MKNSSGRALNRRQFIKNAFGATAVPWILSGCATEKAGRPAPSKRIAVGLIGAGARGTSVIQGFLREPDAQVLAVCDVDALHYRDREWGQGPAYGREAAKSLVEEYYARQGTSGAYQGCVAYADYRELCGREDLDAVVVATPDHWHALCVMEGLRSGKDIYCEKPETHFFSEGQLVYREVPRRGAIFQTGSQQRSDPLFRHAVELVMNGHIGKVHQVEVGLPSGYSAPQGSTKVEKPPDHLDYDFWCGPAEKLPYMRARHHRWWRGHTAFGGGVLMDWIGHHNDIAHWALGLDRSGPLRVEARGWAYPDTGVYDTPEHYEIYSEYAGGVTISISDSHRMGTQWVGENGWVYVTRGTLEASEARLAELTFETGPRKAYVSPGHVRNFLDSVIARTPCVAPAETGHRSITPGHLGYVANLVGRPLDWDPQEERILEDAEADRLLRQVSYRSPWTMGPTGRES